MRLRKLWLVGTLVGAAFSNPVAAQVSNEVAGTWSVVSATAEEHGRTSYPYGPNPQGMLVFTRDMRFIELLRDPRIPRFRSNERGRGANEENRAVMAGTLSLYGRYSVDAKGEFSGNSVEGSSFPNWIGDVRTTRELTMAVQGDRMTENFQRPGGVKVVIVWERVEPSKVEPVP